jgi:coenzyme F420-reducing hydrogenase delta subunit
MEKYEKHFKTITESETIGLPVTENFYKSGNLAYFYRILPIEEQRVRIIFEGYHIEEWFPSTEERDQFIEFFRKKHREASTFGKNKS